MARVQIITSTDGARAIHATSETAPRSAHGFIDATGRLSSVILTLDDGVEFPAARGSHAWQCMVALCRVHGVAAQ